MFDLFEQIGEWIKQGLIDAIMAQFATLFDFVNDQVGAAAANVGTTPGDFNPGVFAMIRGISDTVIVPIAGMILTFVMTYELIQMIIEKNNMHDFDTFNIYKWIFKTFVAVYILTHTFDIVMAVFDVGQHVIGQSAGIISGSLDVSAALADLQPRLEAMGVWELMGLWLETNIVYLCMGIMSILIFIITFGRMIEIYLTVSVAPIPFSTMANREWGQMGNNYLRSLFAVAFQGFLIMICIGIYAVLVQGIAAADSVHGAIWITAGYTALLCFSLFKTGSLAKSIFNAH
jgi:hypothetical protein